MQLNSNKHYNNTIYNSSNERYLAFFLLLKGNTMLSNVEKPSIMLIVFVFG